MKKIVIFGATGNVGSYLTKYAAEFFDKDEYEVIAVGRRPKANAFAKMGVPYYSVDVTKPEDFEKLPIEGVHAVMLLAAQIPSYMADYDGGLYLSSITMGAYNVLEWCRKVGADRVIYTQTVFDISLAAAPGKVLAPDTPPAFSYTGDHAMYVISKNAALEIMEHYWQEYGIKKFVFRLPTIYSYSPYHYYYPNGVKTKRPVYTMIERAMAGETLEVWGDPNYSKDMVYVDDFSQEPSGPGRPRRGLLQHWHRHPGDAARTGGDHCRRVRPGVEPFQSGLPPRQAIRRRLFDGRTECQGRAGVRAQVRLSRVVRGVQSRDGGGPLRRAAPESWGVEP